MNSDSPPGDATRRRAAIAEFYTEDCEVYVGPGKFVGREALDKFAGDLRATHPHFVYTPRGEPPEYTGLDIIIVRGGKIAALYAFLDSIPPR